MSKDCLRNRRTALNLTETEIRELAWNDLLLELSRYLEEGGATNKVFNIPTPDHRLHNASVLEGKMEHDATTGSFFDENQGSLNEERKVFLIQYAMVYLMER